MEIERTDQDNDERPWWSNELAQARVVSSAEDLIEKDIKPLLELRRMLVGPHFAGGVGDTSTDSPTNVVYSIYASLKALCLGGEVKPVLDTDPGSKLESIALGYESAAQEVWRRSKVMDQVELAFADMLCGFGGLFVETAAASTVKIRAEERQHLRPPLGTFGLKSAPLAEAQVNVDASVHHPRVHYLPPGTWGWDRRAHTFAESEFFWMDTTHNALDLIERARKEKDGWRLKALMYAKEHETTESKKHKEGGSNRTSHRIGEMDRDRLTLRTLYVKKAKVEGVERPEHHHWVSYTLWFPEGSFNDAIWVKDPEYAFGPPWGNFVLLRHHMLGEDSTPLSAMVANFSNIVANQAIHAVAYRRLQRLRKKVVVNTRDKQKFNEVEQGMDDSLVAVNTGGDPLQMQEIVLGGLDASLVAGIEYLDRMFALSMGFDSANRGAAEGGDVTATETAVATQASSSLSQDFQGSFNRGLSELARTTAWFIGHDSTFFVRADYDTRVAATEAELQSARGRGRAVAGAGQPNLVSDLSDYQISKAARNVARDQSGQVQGGDFVGVEGEDLDFNDFRFSINIYKQSARSPEARRQQSAQMRAEIAQVIQWAHAFPAYDWVSELRQIEEDYGVRGIVARFDAAKASQVAQLAVMGGQSPAQVDVGGAGRGQSTGGPRFNVQQGPVDGRGAGLRRSVQDSQEQR